MTTGEQKQRVLVVDDDPEARATLAGALAWTSLPIDETPDGSTAIELLSRSSYSVVLLDIVVPDIEPSGVLEAIAEAPTSPIVLVVTAADRSFVERFDTRKIHGIVRKPFDPQDVASVVASCVELRGRSTFEAMVIATMLSGVPLMALLKM